MKKFASIRYNDRGALFAQNIRLMASPWEFTACMEDDNLAANAAPLAFDDAKFSRPGADDLTEWFVFEKY